MNPSTTYKLRTPSSPHAIYFTITRCGGVVTGLFVNSKEMGSHEWVTALMTSYVRQINQGRSVQEVITDMKETFYPKEGLSGAETRKSPRVHSSPGVTAGTGGRVITTEEQDAIYREFDDMLRLDEEIAATRRRLVELIAQRREHSITAVAARVGVKYGAVKARWKQLLDATS